jgi:DNA replication initiation complex subunit (GINS family)
MGDYFDDDDLINDYMDEDFEPPTEYDDEFIAEELEVAGPTDKNPGEEPMDVDVDVDPPQDDAEENGMNEQGVPTAVRVTIPQPNTDVYSFERYVSFFHLD